MEEKLNQKSMEGMKELLPSDLQLGDYVSLYNSIDERFYPARVTKLGERTELYILNDDLIKQIPKNKFVNQFAVDPITSQSKIYDLPIFFNILYILGATDKKLFNGLFGFRYTLLESQYMRTDLCIEEERSLSWINSYVKDENLKKIDASLEVALSNEIKIPAINSTRLLQHFLRLFRPESLTKEVIEEIEKHLSAYNEDGDSWNQIVKIKK